ncbi:LOW QUALITY PROTEIN: uncharacterized protein Dana_GF28082 [Drosophila ananassae]|uniref:Uncharacterized protein n=1 Tax=Drosophila ananassae TaxID=7217 RepID=A0A0P8Y0N9_DROAN|nr:LOW QUALITY PROTEIN: uncharacterized protein Dana_GF28082 [Drosophila ananassae]
MPCNCVPEFLLVSVGSLQNVSLYLCERRMCVYVCGGRSQLLSIIFQRQREKTEVQVARARQKLCTRPYTEGNGKGLLQGMGRD